MRLLYTPEAITDLRRLREFIAEKNPDAAEKVGPQLVADISRLTTLPYLGRKVQRAPNPEVVRSASLWFASLTFTASWLHFVGPVSKAPGMTIVLTYVLNGVHLMKS